jgi:hypothetical protein
MGVFMSVIPRPIGHSPFFFPAVFVNMQIFVVGFIGLVIVVVFMPMG